MLPSWFAVLPDTKSDQLDDRAVACRGLERFEGRASIWRRRALGSAIGALVSLGGLPAAAQEMPRPRWVYTAPAGCPSSSELEAALRARIPAASLEGDPRTFVIEVSRSGGLFEGRLAFSDDEGERVVQEPTCEAVVQALVLFTAIAFDPSVSPRVQAPPPAPPAPVPAPPAPAAPRAVRRTDAVPPAPRRRPPATLAFGAGGGVTNGPVPGLAPVFTASAVLHQPLSAERGLAVRAGAKVTQGESEVSSGRLEANLVAGYIELTPTVAWRSLSIAGGPALAMGSLTGTGQDIAAARTTNAFWADVGGVLRGAVRTGGIGFEAYAVGAVALTPRTYMLQRPIGERAVHTTPPFLVTIGAEIVFELGRGL